MLRKPHGMPVLLVLAVILLLSGCAADPGVGLRDESGDNAAAATALLEEAVARREAIVNTSTEIVWSETFTPGETYTGTAYYVSNQGDDGNDGLSPETAWATLARVNQASLAYGDAVFFERGGVWRNTTVETKEGSPTPPTGRGQSPGSVPLRRTEEIRLSGRSGGREKTGRISGFTIGICPTAAPSC